LLLLLFILSLDIFSSLAVWLQIQCWEFSVQTGDEKPRK